MELNINTLKALDLHTSTNCDRKSLTGIWVHIDDDKLTFVTTDGHTLLKYNFPLEMWGNFQKVLKDEFGFKLQDEPANGFLVLNKKFRKDLGGLVFNVSDPNGAGDTKEIYPNYRAIIPDQFTCDPRETPQFSFDTYAKVSKTYKLIGKPAISLEGIRWNSRAGASAIHIDGNTLIVLMPIRTPEDDDDFWLDCVQKMEARILSDAKEYSGVN